MARIFSAINGLSTLMIYIAGAGLLFILFLTVSDVVLRVFNMPITGVYDLTMMTGGVVIGFALPYSTLKKAHVYMEFYKTIFSPGWTKVVTALTRFLGIIFFVASACTLMLYGVKLYRVGEVSPTMGLPMFPVVFGMGVSCLLTSVILLKESISVFIGEET